MLKTVLVFGAALLAATTSSPIKKADIQLGCQSCHAVDPTKINVHLIPHSHDDVGWLKTVDQYFYGSHNEIQKAGVQYIISSTVESLKSNPDRRFIQVETAFFWKWWQHQTDSIREDVINLVNNGQLELINAAWSMNDEAAVNYQSTIDQFTLGLRTINDTLGKCGTPRIGWQIDPFGHSREHTSLLAQMGFDGVFFARLDFEDKQTRIKEKTMEVIWKGSANLDNTNVFTNAFPEFYYPPGGFCFDVTCGDEMIVDDSNSPDYNVPRKVDDFGKRMLELAEYYQTKNVLIPMGGDFQYQAAERNFINMDRLIKAFEGHDQINLIYSTPSCYMKAVNDEATANNVEFVQKVDDFFPYASDGHQYWTGYFTSRPNAKRFERQSNNILQAAKQMSAFATLDQTDMFDSLRLLKEAMGILQHHDAITGTAKQAVAKDYSRLLAKGIDMLEKPLADKVESLLLKDTSSLTLDLHTCLLTNVSICAGTDSDSFVVSIQNPLARPVTAFVRVPVPDSGYKVTGPDGEVTDVDVVDSISSFSYIKDLPDKPQPKELVFEAQNVPALGVKLYVVEKSDKSAQVQQTKQVKFGDDTTGFEIDDATGLLKSVTMNGQTLAIKQEFLYYEGYNGNNNGDADAASGAYLFRPLDNTPTVVADKVAATSVTGKVVDEVHQVVNDWVSQVIRVYKGADKSYIEFDWLIGPIEVNEDKNVGKEIVTRFTVEDFNTADTFYTDSNGRELIKRVKNKRYDYEYDSTREPVSSNYYPVTSKIQIRDESKKVQVSLLNDRAQGGTSLGDGQLELMLHRRLLKDDAKGVDEALNDTEFGQPIVARGQIQLVVGSTEAPSEGMTIAAEERVIALEKLLQPLMMVGGVGTTLDDVSNTHNLAFEGLKKSLPDNVHLLTLEPWKDNTLLLRLEHILEKNEDAKLSTTATVDLTDLFTLFSIEELKETTLAANQWLEEYENEPKLEWNLKDGSKVQNKPSTNAVQADLQVTLEPMQIRTFVVNAKKN